MPRVINFIRGREEKKQLFFKKILASAERQKEGNKHWRKTVSFRNKNIYKWRPLKDTVSRSTKLWQ